MPRRVAPGPRGPGTLGGVLQPIEIESLDDSRVAFYRNLKDADLRRIEGRFIVEGRGNVRRLVACGDPRPESLLMTMPALRAMERELAALGGQVPIYVASRDLLRQIVGFDLHRGCLAVAPRPGRADDDAGALQLARAIAKRPGPARLVLLEALTNHDNVGGIFRNAMAFGVDAVLLCPQCCDPLYRKAVRTSMGASFCVPFARLGAWPAPALTELGAAGFVIWALDPRGRPLVPAEIAEAPPPPEKLALLFGTEGAGISEAARSVCDDVVRIEMAPGFDSLNVSTASGIAMHHVFSAHRARHALGLG